MGILFCANVSAYVFEFYHGYVKTKSDWLLLIRRSMKKSITRE